MPDLSPPRVAKIVRVIMASLACTICAMMAGSAPAQDGGAANLGLSQRDCSNRGGADCRSPTRPFHFQSNGQPRRIVFDAERDLYRFELKPGDRWKNERAGSISERAEAFAPERLAWGKPYWISFTTRLDPGPPTDQNWLILTQIAATPDPQDVVAPPVVVMELLKNDLFHIGVRTNPQNPMRTIRPIVTLFEDRAFQRGRAYRFVYRVRFDADGTGQVDCWRDGVRIVSYKGPLGYINERGNYLKFGLYRYPSTQTLGVEFSQMKISERPLAISSRSRRRTP